MDSDIQSLTKRSLMTDVELIFMRKQIKVFLASPNDLCMERQLFREEIQSLNIGFADGANVKFIALGWEDVFSVVGARGQGEINELIDECASMGAGGS